MSEAVRVTDEVGMLGIDATDYGDVEHVTSVGVGKLLQVMTVLDELGWREVDVGIFDDDGADFPLLVLQPPDQEPFHPDQAALTVAPLTEDGRTRRFEEDST